MKLQITRLSSIPKKPSLAISAVPIAVLLLTFILIIVFMGPQAISDYSQPALLGSAAIAAILALKAGSMSRRSLIVGMRRSATQILPAIPMLICIAALATTWMMSGIVPTLIDYGLMLLNPKWFLLTTCAVCAMVSVLTGSSWSTIATIGVAFMGIGSVMGYSAGWVAGAVISGAYFGDKISPLSDTTVLASSTCGVDLFSHIRYMMYTTVPAMSLALIIYGLKGLCSDVAPLSDTIEMIDALHATFNITPWALIIPAVTITLIVLRVSTIITLASSAIMGAVGVFLFQPDMSASVIDVLKAMWSGFESTSGVEIVDSLATTEGILGMMPVVYLVISALIFGWMMISSGMLSTLADAITRKLRRRSSVVASTLATGIVLNACTADQYLSLIIDGNMFRNIYRRCGFDDHMLSRTIEDGVSVTSVLIPWSSCGVTQSTVLGVSTLTYLPYCVFNYLTPVMSMVMIWTGYKIRYIVAPCQKVARE